MEGCYPWRLNREHHHLKQKSKLKKNHAENKRVSKKNRIEYPRLEGKRNWRVLEGKREVLLEGKIEKGEEEDGRAAEEDVAKVSIINKIVLSSQTEQTKVNETKNPIPCLSFLFLISKYHKIC